MCALAPPNSAYVDELDRTACSLSFKRRKTFIFDNRFDLLFPVRRSGNVLERIGLFRNRWVLELRNAVNVDLNRRRAEGEGMGIPDDEIYPVIKLSVGIGSRKLELLPASYPTKHLATGGSVNLKTDLPPESRHAIPRPGHSPGSR